MNPDSTVAVLLEAYASVLSNEGTSIEMASSGMFHIRREDDTIYRLWNLRYGAFSHSPKEVI